MADQAVFFSVVIPAYNAGAFLAQTLQSVRDQTFGCYECIIVDDGSTDDTHDVVTAYMDDSRFQALTIEHSGIVGHVRNVGIRNARGSYVAFLDADDAWMPEKLATLHEWVQRTAAPVLFSDAI